MVMHTSHVKLTVQVPLLPLFLFLSETSEQIGNAPSNLWIVDFSHGHTGLCHDAQAFEHTAAYQYPDWLFEGNEFAWMDSAYPCQFNPFLYTRSLLHQFHRMQSLIAMSLISESNLNIQWEHSKDDFSVYVNFKFRSTPSLNMSWHVVGLWLQLSCTTSLSI